MLANLRAPNSQALRAAAAEARRAASRSKLLRGPSPAIRTRRAAMTPRGVEDGDLSELALQISPLGEVADCPVQGAIDGAGSPVGGGNALEEVDDQGVGLGLLNSPVAYTHIHSGQLQSDPNHTPDRDRRSMVGGPLFQAGARRAAERSCSGAWSQPAAVALGRRGEGRYPMIVGAGPAAAQGSGGERLGRGKVPALGGVCKWKLLGQIRASLAVAGLPSLEFEPPWNCTCEAVFY